MLTLSKSLQLSRTLSHRVQQAENERSTQMSLSEELARSKRDLANVSSLAAARNLGGGGGGGSGGGGGGDAAKLKEDRDKLYVSPKAVKFVKGGS